MRFIFWLEKQKAHQLISVLYEGNKDNKPNDMIKSNWRQEWVQPGTEAGQERPEGGRLRRSWPRAEQWGVRGYTARANAQTARRNQRGRREDGDLRYNRQILQSVTGRG